MRESQLCHKPVIDLTGNQNHPTCGDSHFHVAPGSVLKDPDMNYVHGGHVSVAARFLKWSVFTKICLDEEMLEKGEMEVPDKIILSFAKAAAGLMSGTEIICFSWKQTANNHYYYQRRWIDGGDWAAPLHFPFWRSRRSTTTCGVVTGLNLRPRFWRS